MIQSIEMTNNIWLAELIAEIGYLKEWSCNFFPAKQKLYYMTAAQ